MKQRLVLIAEDSFDQPVVVALEGGVGVVVAARDAVLVSDDVFGGDVVDVDADALEGDVDVETCSRGDVEPRGRCSRSGRFRGRMKELQGAIAMGMLARC